MPVVSAESCSFATTPDLDDNEQAVLVSGGRRVLRKTFRRRLLLAVVGAVSTILVAGALLRQHPMQDSIDERREVQEFVKPFKMCGGGSSYTGPTCCQSGCACIEQSKYYSQCEVPGGATACNPAQAAKEVRLAQDRLGQSKPNAAAAVKAYKQVMARVREAKKREMQAQLVLRDKIERGKAARQHKNAAVAVATRARENMEVAEKAYDNKVSEFDGLKTAVDNIDTIVETRHSRAASGKPCPGVWGDCSGDQCCKAGCICVKKSAFYFECQVPPGKMICDVGGEEADNTKKREALTVLTRQKADLLEKRDAAREGYATAHRQAQAAMHDANIAGAAKDRASSHHKRNKANLKEAQRLAQQARAAAVHARAAIGFHAKAVAAWKDAALGTTCTKKSKVAETKASLTKAEEDDLEKDDGAGTTETTV